MGRHYPDSHPDADANTDSDCDAVPEPRRQPGRFTIADEFAGRVTCADVCISAAVAERKPIARCSLAECHSFTNAARDDSIADCKVFSVTIPERDAFADEKRLTFAGKKLRRVATEFPD